MIVTSAIIPQQSENANGKVGNTPAEEKKDEANALWRRSRLRSFAACQ